MDWRERLSMLILVGGSLSSSGCIAGGACNASPDPCCSMPNSAECTAYNTCRSEGRDYYRGKCQPQIDVADDLSVSVDLAHAVHDFAVSSDGGNEDDGGGHF